MLMAYTKKRKIGESAARQRDPCGLEDILWQLNKLSKVGMIALYGGRYKYYNIGRLLYMYRYIGNKLFSLLFSMSLNGQLRLV